MSLLHAAAFLAALIFVVAQATENAGQGYEFAVGLFLLGAALCWSCCAACRHEKNKQGAQISEQASAWHISLPPAASIKNSPQKNPDEYSGAAVLRRCYVWRYVVVMDFLCAGGKRENRCRVVIFSDSVGVDEFRRLRVRLRYGLHLHDGEAQPPSA